MSIANATAAPARRSDRNIGGVCGGARSPPCAARGTRRADGTRCPRANVECTMKSVFSRSLAAGLGAALLATLPCAAPAKSSAAVLPVDWAVSAPQIVASCAAKIAALRRGAQAIVTASASRSFETVVLPLENASSDFNDDLAAEGFLYNVSTDAKGRTASLKCSTDAGNALSDLGARPDLYRALTAAQASGTAKDAAQRKLTQLWITSFKRSGAGLPAAQRREFVALEQKQTDDQNKFQANLGNDASTIAISAAQAQSLPPDFVAASLKKTADGYTVPVNESTVGPFLQNETDTSARKAFYITYNNRGGSTNVKLLEDAVATRDKLAHLLGYPTWAAFVLADRMAGSSQRVQTFLAQIDAAIMTKARQERDEDAALAKADGRPTFDQWDQTYYENLLRKTKYAVDQNEVKQYFPVQHVVDSVLSIYQQLLGVRFRRVTVPVWQQQVQAYDVADAATGNPLGRFYLDLFARPGTYDHFAIFPVIARRVMPDGTVRLAESAIVGNCW